MSRMNGFTLIELLIVVAIIAILAAIAVPNFLEAQTRAKVSRDRANQRSIVTALEAYRIDNKGALPARATDPAQSSNPTLTGAENTGWVVRDSFYLGLSTPVAYMTTVPQSEFHRLLYAKFYNYYGFTTYRLWDNNIAKAILADSSAPGLWEPKLGTLYSLDQLKAALRAYYLPSFSDWGHANANYVIFGRGPSFTESLGTIIPYDPSNGTVSSGFIAYYN